jgi:Tfp pilus assembly protein PilF
MQLLEQRTETAHKMLAQGKFELALTEANEALVAAKDVYGMWKGCDDCTLVDC